VLTSTDGLTWKAPATSIRSTNEKDKDSPTSAAAASMQQDGLLFQDIFYLTAPIKLNDWFYAIGKTQENSIGSTILCRSQSLEGPFERGPLLARGMRHGDMHFVGGNKMLIFYTLIGDAPERILLATLEMRNKTDWESWKLLPGPTILTPTLEFEHGNANNTVPSEPGSAGCSSHAQFRDPSFLRDDDDDDDHDKNTSRSDAQHHHRFTGTLFYTVHGERFFAASRLDIDLCSFWSYSF
jgi:hypothetical protein